MTTPTTLPEALTEIEELRGQVRELLRLLGQEAPQDTGAAGLSTSEIAALNGMPEISVAQVSLERKQTGHEQAQTLADIRDVIETLPDVIFTLDLRGNLVGWNKQLERVTGFVPQELKGRPAVSFAPECEREQTAAAIQQAFEQGYTELEGHLLTKAGRMIPYHWTGATLENHLGHVIGLIGVRRDRTVLKHAEEALRTSEARFRELVETTTDWMWEINELGAYTYCSPKIREFLGYEPDEAIGKTPFDFMPPEEAHRVAALFGPIAAARKPFAGIENINRRKDGQLVTFECRGIPIFGADGSFRGYRGFDHDITERKRAESALQESESHFRAMIENSSDIITVLDLDGTIRFESPSFERLLGYAQHEIDGRIAFDFIHPDDLPAVIEKFQRIVQQPGETHTAEFRFRHQDGSWLSLEGVGRATCDARSRSCVIVNSRDITERKRAERSLLQTRDLLTSFVENVPAAVAMLDKELRYVAVSRRWLTDYRLGDEPLVGRRHYDVFPEIQDMKEWQEIHQRCLSGSVERCEEDRFVRADGSEDWLRWEVRPWHDVTGEIGGIIIFTEVITARKQAEAALRVSEERLALAVEGSTDILWDAHRLPGEPWYTPQTPIWWSPRVRGLLALEESELFETLEQWAMRLHPDDKDGVFGKLAAHIEHRVPYDAEYRLRTNRGDYLWIRARGQASWDEQGEIRRMSGSCQDITERKRVEEERQKQEILISLMFNTGPACITLGAADGTLLHMNPTGLNMVEACGESDVVGGSVFSLVTPEHRDAFISMHRSVIEGHAHTLQFEIQGLKGTRRWMESYAVPFRNPVTGQTEKLAVAHDITERAQAEEALRRSEARLKEAQRIAHIGSWELDLVTNRLTWSDEIYRIFEIDSESFGATYEAFLQLVHPDDRTLVNQAYTESITARTPYNITHRLLMPDGRIKFVREQCETQYGRDGLPLRSSGTVQDITKQKEAEEALAHNHALLTAIMDASIDLISIKDLQGRYVHINRAGAEAVGMPAEAVIGWDDGALWGREFAASRRTSDHLVTESGQTITVEEQGTLLEDIADYLTTKAPYRDSEGSIIGVIGIARNITEWKRVEKDQQKALTLLINVINATPDLIFVKDRDLRTLLCNNAFAQALGKTPEDLIGRSDIENGWNPELVRGNSDAGFPGYESDDRQALAGKVVHNSSDPANVNGEVRIFDTYKVPLRDETGGVIGILGVSRDVTERKRMEEMLSQRERDLRAAVEERERISEDLHDGILQSIFAVGLGLESCRTLVSELPLPRKKTTAPLMAALNRAIGHLNHIMAEVRNFIAGIESHVLQGGDVGSTLRAMVQAMCESNGTAWRVTIEEAAVRELSTEQAYHVMNIVREALSNSLRHSGAWRIALSLKRLRRSVRLSVTDNGKGFIPDSVHDVGHGLANMAARARKLGGRIEVHSRPRKGTKVLLDIPRRPVDE